MRGKWLHIRLRGSFWGAGQLIICMIISNVKESLLYRNDVLDHPPRPLSRRRPAGDCRRLRLLFDLLKLQYTDIVRRSSPREGGGRALPGLRETLDEPIVLAKGVPTAPPNRCPSGPSVSLGSVPPSLSPPPSSYVPRTFALIRAPRFPWRIGLRLFFLRFTLYRIIFHNIAYSHNIA